MRVLCVCAVLCAVTVSAFGQDKAIEDWKHFNDILEVYYSHFNSEYSQSDKGAEYIKKWEEWSKDASEFIPYFKKTYGDSLEALTKAFKGKEPPKGVNNYPQQLADTLYPLKIDEVRTKIAGWLVKAGDEHYAKWEKYDAPAEKAELKLKYAERALTAYKGAAAIDPDSVSDQLAKAEKAVEESEGAAKKALEAKEWPGHNPDFAGPGDPDDLAAAALKLLERLQKEGKTWSKPEYDDEHIPLAACVVATAWGVEKKAPLTQVPTQYRLKMFVAFSGTKDDDIAYGYYMYFYTNEEEGIEKAPPFEYCNSEQYACFKLLKEKIGKGGGAISKGGSKGLSGASGGTGLFRRFILALVLVAAGLAASSGNMLAAKFAFLKPSVAVLGAKRSQLGMASLAVGALAFLLTLLHFAIFPDLLPQAVAVALGLALLHKGGTESGEGEAQKPANGLAKASAAVAPFELPLGLAAVILGFLHVLIGGGGLF